jgi:hypothetical protein
METLSLNDNVVTLISIKDNTKVEVSTKSARHAGLLKNLLEEYKDEKELSIPEVDGVNLKYIADFLNFYKDTEPVDVPKPLEKYDIAETYGKWDDEFISQFNEKKALWDLMEAANYLDCKPLLELAASKVACMIQDLTGHQMLEYFELEEDMTDEDVIKMEADFEKEKDAEREMEMKKEEEMKKEKEEEQSDI